MHTFYFSVLKQMTGDKRQGVLESNYLDFKKGLHFECTYNNIKAKLWSIRGLPDLIELSQ